jgi:hypothetical protein
MPTETVSNLEGLPEAVARGLESFVHSAVSIYGQDLKSVVLYGSGAEARLRAASDVNVILVLASFDARQAEAMREPFAAAQAAIRLTAMFLLEGELEQAVLAFGQKFSDILRRHRILYGPDPFAGVQVPRAAAVLRLRQVLLNLTLRLREEYIERGSTPERMRAAVAEASGPLRSCAATLAELEGSPQLAPKEALINVVTGFQDPGWEQVLAHISDAREERELLAEVADQTLFRMMELAARMAARVARLV